MNYLGRLILTIGLLTSLSKVQVIAQGEPYLELHEVSTGFPTNGIYMSLAEENGFIWLAGSGGIIRFDGKNTLNFNRFNSPILEDDITGIRRYSKDTLLFYCTGYIGIQRNYILYRGSKGKFQIEVRPLENLILAGYGPDKPIYFDSRPGENQHINRKDLIQAIQSGFFSGPDLQHIYAYMKGSMYYLENGKCAKFDQKKETLPIDYIFLIGHKFIQIRPGGEYGSYTPGKGMVYRTNLSLDTLLFQKDNKGQIYRKLNRPKNSENILTSNYNEIYKLVLNYAGELSIQKVTDNIDVSGISSISFDPIGNRYLISTLDEGLKIYKIPEFRSLHKNQVVPRKDNYITAVIALAQDTLFTSYGLITNDGKFIKDLRNIGPPQGSNALFHEGDSIFFQKGNDIYSFNLRNSLIRKAFRCPFRLTCFFRSSDGKLWVSGYDELAIQKGDSIEIIHKYIKGNENGVILKLKELEPGFIEVLSNIGSFRLNLKTLETSGSKYFSKLKVLDFWKDHNDIWIASYGDGIFRWTNGKLHKLPIDQEGNLVFAQNILYDGKGWFWFSTNNGIVRVCKKDLEAYCVHSDAPVSIVSYNLSDGLLSNVLYGNGNPSVSITKDGYIFYPSVKGIVYTNVNEVQNISFKPEISIDHIQTSDAILMGDTISLSHGFKNLSVKISIPYPGSKGNLYSFYRIEGFSEQWNPLNQNGLIEVNSLPPGNYRLVIRYSYFDAHLNHSIWIEKYLYISVQFPFYRKWWFVLFCILFGVFILYIIYRSRLRVLLQRKKELENSIEKRTSELRMSVESYQKTTEQLYRNQQLFDSLFSTVLHDLGSPLRFLSMLSSRLKNKWNQLPNEEIERDLDALNASTEEAGHIAHNMLVWLKTQKEELEFKKEIISLAEVIQSHIRIYQWIAEEKGLKIIASIPEHIKIEVNEELLGILIRNIVDNAVKYAPRGVIEITSYEADTFSYIEIRDQGKGIAEEYITELNMGNSPFKVESNGKLGFRLIFELIHSMQGSLKFENRKEGGLSVLVKLPVK